MGTLMPDGMVVAPSGALVGRRNPKSGAVRAAPAGEVLHANTTVWPWLGLGLGLGLGAVGCLRPRYWPSAPAPSTVPSGHTVVLACSTSPGGAARTAPLLGFLRPVGP